MHKIEENLSKKVQDVHIFSHEKKNASNASIFKPNFNASWCWVASYERIMAPMKFLNIPPFISTWYFSKISTHHDAESPHTHFTCPRWKFCSSPRLLFHPIFIRYSFHPILVRFWYDLSPFWVLFESFLSPFWVLFESVLSPILVRF
jgi:hypothetical protein